MTALLLFFQIMLLALISPGPNYALLLSVARYNHLRMRCYFVVFGIAIGEFLWAACALFGVSAIINHWPLLRLILLLLGAVFLGLMGILSLKSAHEAFRSKGKARRQQAQLLDSAPMDAPDHKLAKDMSNSQALLLGLGYMALNGKAALFWISLTQVLLPADLALVYKLIALFGATLLSLLWHLFLATIMTSARARSIILRMGAGLDAVLGLVFVLLSLLGLYSSINSFLA